MAAREATEALLARLAPALAAYVADRQGEDWSPEQITGTLTKHHPGGSAMRVSHETIYKTPVSYTHLTLPTNREV